MAKAAYVSLIGEQLDRRGMSVSELHRRLAEAGHRVTRAALDQLVTDQPIRSAQIAVLVPVLDLLGLEPRHAFRAISPEEAEERRRVRAAARGLLARRAGRERTTGVSAEAEAAYDDAIALAARALRATHPHLFDARGRPLRRKIARAIAARAGDRRSATETEYAAVTERAGRVLGRLGA
ncbi:MAG TPA: hypothetical protein VGM69_18905 [Chloroflexota bacterium]